MRDDQENDRLVKRHAALNRPLAPVCSICIANYNGVTLLADCIDSVLRQQGNPNIEIIVHDDASTDESIAFLREKYPQVEVLAGAQNVGFCISNNRMAEHARGEYILLLNNDAALLPDALSTLLEAAKEQEPAGILTLPQFDWVTGALVDKGCMLDPFYNPVPNLDPLRHDVAIAIGACLWISRDQWNELGGFPDWMESIAEDLYLCCLARTRGMTVRSTSVSGFRHRLGASFGGARVEENRLKSSLRRRRLSERNKTFALVIFTPTPIFWPLLAAHLLTLLIEGLIISLVRLDFRIFRDIYANVPVALLHNRKMLAGIRHSVQDARSVSARNYFHAFSPWPRKLTMALRFGIPRITR